MPRSPRNTADADTAQRVAAIMALGHDDTTPTEPADVTPDPEPTRELAPIDGRTDDDEFYARSIKIAVRADTLAFEARAVVDVRALVDEARRLLNEAQDQQDACAVVDEGIVAKLQEDARRFTQLTEGWGMQRGLNGDGGS